jgi:ankyrin repeat protein
LGRQHHQTPLFAAIWSENAEVAKLLVEGKADVNVCNMVKTQHRRA